MFQVNFFCPRWGFEKISWNVFLKSVKREGYAGIEWFPFGEACNYNSVLPQIEGCGLKLCYVFAVTKPYTGFNAYVKILKTELRKLAAIRSASIAPLFISAQTGREFFSLQQTEECLHVCNEISLQSGIPVYQETHRNKWSYAAHVVAPVLKKNAAINLTLDVSHWYCVSESYLADQQQAVNLAVAHAKHLHARVGHTQGPQVIHPAMPAYKEALDAHLQVWDKYVKKIKKSGAQVCTITPEFGPPPYLTAGSSQKQAQRQQWELNVWMKNFLQKRYNGLQRS